MTTQTAARPAMPLNTTVLAFALFVLAAGGAAVALRRVYVELPPFWAGGARFLVGALILWAVAYIRGIPLPRGRALAGAVLFGVLTVGLAFALAGWGLVETPASRFQILMATVPLLTIFLASVHGLEAITRRGVLGSLLAVAGIAATVGLASSADLSLPHVAAVLLASVFIAEGGVVIKRFPANPPIMTNAIGMTVGGLILVVVSRLAGERWTIPTQPATWIAFLYLVFVVSVAAFLLYMFVLGRWSASKTSYGFVLVPLVTIAVAATLAGEAISPNFLIGAGLVLVGVFVGALLPSRSKEQEVEECKDRSGQVLPRCA